MYVYVPKNNDVRFFSNDGGFACQGSPSKPLVGQDRQSDWPHRQVTASPAPDWPADQQEEQRRRPAVSLNKGHHKESFILGSYFYIILINIEISYYYLLLRFKASLQPISSLSPSVCLFSVPHMCCMARTHNFLILG